MTCLVTMRIPAGRGLVWVVEFDPTQPVDFAPLQKTSGARVAQWVAPLRLKSLRESGAGAPLLHSAPLPSPERRSPSPLGELLRDIEEARAALADRSEKLSELDEVLAPAWSEEREVRNEILATHGRQAGVVVLDLNQAPGRKPLFRRLSQISERWGKQKAERALVGSQVRSLERDIARLEKLIETEKRKEASRGQKSNRRVA